MTQTPTTKVCDAARAGIADPTLNFLYGLQCFAIAHLSPQPTEVHKPFTIAVPNPTNEPEEQLIGQLNALAKSQSTLPNRPSLYFALGDNNNISAKFYPTGMSVLSKMIKHTEQELLSSKNLKANKALANTLISRWLESYAKKLADASINTQTQSLTISLHTAQDGGILEELVQKWADDLSEEKNESPQEAALQDLLENSVITQSQHGDQHLLTIKHSSIMSDCDTDALRKALVKELSKDRKPMDSRYDQLGVSILNSVKQQMGHTPSAARR